MKGISDETKGVLQNSMLSEQIAIDKADVEKPLIPLQTATTNTIVASSVLSTLNTKQMKLALNDSAQTTLSNNAVEDKHVTQQFKQLSSQSNENTLQTNAFSGLDKNELLTNKNQFLNLIEQHQSPLKNATTMMLNTSSNLVDTSANASPITLAIAPASTTEINLSSVIKPEITTTVGRQGWSQGMGKQILWMVNQNINSAEIRLNPAHLGPVEVRIDMQGDQINLALSSHHAAVREAMEAALPKLREMLDDTGFKLAGADISGQTFAEQRQSTFSDNNFDADKKQNSNGVTGMNIDATLSSNNDTHVLLNDAVSSAVDLYV